MSSATRELAGLVGAAAAAAALGIPRSSYYRHQRPAVDRRPRPTLAWALPPEEVRAILDLLHSPRFADCAPAEIVAMLLDEGIYLCSERTMYRLLAAAGEVHERRAVVHRNHYAAPELLATGPNQVWSWDVTKLKGPGKWNYFCLYVLLDIFSRLVTGWLVANRESAALACDLIAQAVADQGITPGQLQIHADRGSAMVSKSVHQLLSDLDIRATHSRPHVSNDNPVLRGPVQDPQVPTRVPRALRLGAGRPPPRSHLLPLVQHRAPPLRHRHAHPGDRPLRPREGGA